MALKMNKQILQNKFIDSMVYLFQDSLNEYASDEIGEKPDFMIYFSFGASLEITESIKEIMTSKGYSIAPQKDDDQPLNWDDMKNFFSHKARIVTIWEKGDIKKYLFEAMDHIIFSNKIDAPIIDDIRIAYKITRE